ncbi:Protein phosphatase PP2A regulatory subunit B [Binucleata daphniae]
MHNSTSTVYVGDLHPQVLESDLFKLFSDLGDVVAIRVVRGPTHTTSCYAYINFQTQEAADLAVQKLNHTTLHNRQIRVMHYNKARKDYNIIVTNLAPEVDNKILYDTFSVFGDIISCKVATDANNKTKGYGFVSYKTKTAAKKAITLAHQSNMKGTNIKVTKHLKQSERESKKPELQETFTNVYVKNFTFNEEELTDIMKRFGEITSIHFPKKSNGELKGVLFCNYTENQSALNAIASLHGLNIEDIKKKYEIESEAEDCAEPFYCQRAQSKTEREEEIRKMIQKMSVEGQNYKRNLYVTNIPDMYTEKEIKTLFENIGGGKITSFALKKDTNTAKQFCYVCFQNPNDAYTVYEKGSDLFLNGLKLNVTFFKNKIEREQEKESNAIVYKNNVDYKKSIDKKQLGGDLYNLVLSMAEMFKDDWMEAGAKDEYEFAERITKALLEKPSAEVKNMMGLGNVLIQNISEMMHDEKIWKNKCN